MITIVIFFHNDVIPTLVPLIDIFQNQNQMISEEQNWK